MTQLQQVRWVFSIGGSGYARRATTAAHFESTPSLDASDLTAMAQAAYDTWAGASVSLKDFFPAETTLDHVECFTENLVPIVDPDPLPAPQYKIEQVSVAYSSTGAAVAGGDTGDANPPQVAFVVTLRSDLASRRRRGRMYWPPISFDRSGVDGEVSSVFSGQLADAVRDSISAIESAPSGIVNTNNVIISRQDAITVPVSLYTARTRVDTQRRRLRREIA